MFLETEKQPQSLIDGLEIRRVHWAEDLRNTSLVYSSNLVDECVGVASQPAGPGRDPRIKRALATRPGEGNHADHGEALVLRCLRVADQHAWPCASLLMSVCRIESHEDDGAACELHSSFARVQPDSGFHRMSTPASGSSS